MYQLNNAAHVIFGSLALLGGVAAFVTTKGSTWHIRGGKLFAWTMGLVVVTTLLQMFHEFLVLAVVMCLAVTYLIPSALLSLNRNAPGFTGFSIALMILVGLLFLLSCAVFVRINLASEDLVAGPAMMATMFGLLFAQDVSILRNRPTHPNVWIRRHLIRMILAFTFAIMALVRIGINVGLTLEQTVIFPLLIAFAVILWVRRQYPVG